MNWTKLLAAAGGAAAVGAVLYYILKDDADGSRTMTIEKGDDEKKKKGLVPTVDEITKEEVQQILQEIIRSQEEMKGHMRNLTKELLKAPLTFEQTYKRVTEMQPSDPLEKRGLSMMDFDQLLDKHQGDHAVREAIAKIMGAPSPESTSERAQKISVSQIIDVHKFMLNELNSLVKDFQKLPGKDGYDMKTVTIAAQALVGSKIEAKFGITSEDIESAVLMYHTTLATDQDFANVNLEIQSAMGKLMGTPFNPS
mmetsp:Transcript_10191/g.22927  ORF Transcript_10191/g.22927 Transcript_10191/m.22927 type:complete len:254 (+) Transcript_10191:122-883(+)